MDWRNPREKKLHKEDLIERLISRNHRIPENPVHVEDVRGWVIDEERDRIEGLLEEIVTESNSIEFLGGDNIWIGITDMEDARQYLYEIEETPWFDI